MKRALLPIVAICLSLLSACGDVTDEKLSHDAPAYDEASADGGATDTATLVPSNTVTGNTED